MTASDVAGGGGPRRERRRVRVTYGPERRRSTRRLGGDAERAQRLETLGQVAAGVAHEINTPIQFIGDNVRFLQSSFGDLVEFVQAADELIRLAGSNPELASVAQGLVARAADLDLAYLVEEIPLALDQTLVGIDRVAEIVRALKDLAHPSGEDAVPADVNSVVTEAVVLARHEWKYRATLDADLDPALEPVPCFPSRLGQVLVNLIVNAAHAVEQRFGTAASESGRIRVSTRAVADGVRIEVADNGIGMSSSTQQRAFDPFFTTKPPGQGTGQGLAIARSVVCDQHAGSIALSSRPGEGTTVTVVLPCPGEVMPHPRDR